MSGRWDTGPARAAHPGHRRGDIPPRDRRTAHTSLLPSFPPPFTWRLPGMRPARVCSRAAVRTGCSVAQRLPVTPWLLPSRVDRDRTSLDSPQRPCDVPHQGTPLERVCLFSIAIDNKIRTPRTPRPTAARLAPAALRSTIETSVHSPGPSRSAAPPPEFAALGGGFSWWSDLSPPEA
jgi:hypothetical protein